MSRNDKGVYRIGEVSRLTGTKPFVLRYWETEFPMLQPVKSPKGQRLYRQQDIETVLEIRRLLYEEGFTIAGARRHLSERGIGGNGGSEGRGAARPTQPRKEAEPSERPPTIRGRKALVALRNELVEILTLLKGR